MSGLKEVLYEIVQIGNVVRATAIDPETGIEASVVGSPTMTEFTLKSNAKRKLEYVIKKQKEENKPSQKPGYI